MDVWYMILLVELGVAIGLFLPFAVWHLVTLRRRDTTVVRVTLTRDLPDYIGLMRNCIDDINGIRK